MRTRAELERRLSSLRNQVAATEEEIERVRDGERAAQSVIDAWTALETAAPYEDIYRIEWRGDVEQYALTLEVALAHVRAVYDADDLSGQIVASNDAASVGLNDARLIVASDDSDEATISRHRVITTATVGMR